MVFRGFVREGAARPGNRVEIQGSEKKLSATISTIEKDRRLVEESEAGVDHGFLLMAFSSSDINDAIQAKYEALKDYPEASFYLELLGISEFPVFFSGVGE